MTSKIVGSVTGLWRFPVKSMRGERMGEAELTKRGMVGDRAYALIDTDTGKVVSAKSARLFPELLGCQAAFVEPPQSDRELHNRIQVAGLGHSPCAGVYAAIDAEGTIRTGDLVTLI